MLESPDEVATPPDEAADEAAEEKATIGQVDTVGKIDQAPRREPRVRSSELVSRGSWLFFV